MFRTGFRPRHTRGRSVVALLAFAAVWPSTSLIARAPAVARYSAVAVNLRAAPGSAVTPVDITLTRWSTEAERNTLFTTFTERGQDALLTAIQKMPSVGTIRTPDSVGYDLRYALRTPGPDGAERVSLVTDRPVSYWEAQSGSRVSEYPFTVIELRVGSDGRGEGKLTVATKFMFDPGTRTMVLEDWNIAPVLLQNVRKEGV